MAEMKRFVASFRRPSVAPTMKAFWNFFYQLKTADGPMMEARNRRTLAALER